MLAYTKEELDLMDKIAETLDEMDETTDKYLLADNTKDADAAQKEYMKEIKRVMKQADRLNDLLDADDDFIAEMVLEDEDGKSDALRAIYAELRKLDKTLDSFDGSNSKKSLNAQKKAEQEIKRILNEAGKYDDYNVDEAYLLL